jgi:hypothetical protein
MISFSRLIGAESRGETEAVRDTGRQAGQAYG